MVVEANLRTHGEQESAITVAEVGGVVLDLGEEADLFGVEVEAEDLLGLGAVGEELGELEVERAGDLLEGVK